MPCALLLHAGPLSLAPPQTLSTLPVQACAACRGEASAASLGGFLHSQRHLGFQQSLK